MLIARSLLLPDEGPTRPNLPDFADDEDAWEAPAQAEGSYVGQLPQEDSGLELAKRRHAALALAITEVEQLCSAFESYDPSTRAAELSLRKRVGLLAVVRNAIETVVDIAAQEERLEGPLAPYFAGAYLWLDGITEALTRLARQLSAMQPDWYALRTSIAEVQWLYEMTLVEQHRVDASEEFGGTALGEALEELSTALVVFRDTLDAPFG